MALESQNDFSGGMIRDLPPHLIPTNGVYDADNFIFDQQGRARRRGGTTASYAGTQTAMGYLIGLCVGENLQGPDPTGTIYTAGSGAFASRNEVQYFNQSDGTLTPFIALQGAVGRPTDHLRTLFFPGGNSPTTEVQGAWIAGATGAKADRQLANPAGVVIVANNPIITTAAADNVLTTMQEGQFFEMNKGTSPYYWYVGKIISRIDATHLLVHPAPTASFVPTNCYSLNWYPHTPTYSTMSFSAKHAMSFQNRVVYGCTTYRNTANAAGAIEYHPRRVAWTDLPTEVPSTNDATHTLLGMTWMRTDAISPNNFVDIAEIDVVSGFGSLGENELVIFGQRKGPFKLTGTLLTQSVASAGFTFEVHPITQNVGLLSFRSIQRTSRGLVFAAPEGVMVYDASAMRPIMQGRVLSLWQSLARQGMTVWGSAMLAGNVYMLTVAGTFADSTTTLFCNLDTLAWSRSSSAALQIWDSVRDPSDPNKMWGLRYWPGSTLPSMPGGQVVRLDTITKFVNGPTDSDGTAHAATLMTRAYTGSRPEIVKKTRGARVSYYLNGASTVAITRRTGLDPSLPLTSDEPLNANGTATTLPSGTAPTTRGFGDYAQQGVGVSYRIAQTGTGPNVFEVYGIQHAFRELPEHTA